MQLQISEIPTFNNPCTSNILKHSIKYEWCDSIIGIRGIRTVDQINTFKNYKKSCKKSKIQTFII